MHVINARNVHDALPMAVRYILHNGVESDSRAGRVLVAPHPVTTCYQAPLEMCCFWEERDINPFATLFEGLWMLAGRNDVDYPARFIARMREFSDDGETLHGAYGERWRRRWQSPRGVPLDQLAWIQKNLAENPNCRRQILQIWDASTDLVLPGKDVPCNTTVHFQMSPYGMLDMTVFNRSNDLVWGTYGADAPHFGMLLSYMAGALGVEPGRYWQVSDNWHAYVDTLEKIRSLEMYAPAPYYEERRVRSPYEAQERLSAPHLIQAGEPLDRWEADLQMFMDEEDEALGYTSWFFRRVALPMIRAHKVFKSGNADRYDEALEIIQEVRAYDWRALCEMWLRRRKERYLAKQSEVADVQEV